eukprot:TRINITY_DN8258_c0_g1_i6.p1 TRINITY_DN8258_c0_g1~~TRINITY_DN8258_c0_g1_i6.p1  ORF type:complete len:387 (-),score=33.30 TRINITY_DN8258_c0_g1_i6:141-1301(-)
MSNIDCQNYALAFTPYSNCQNDYFTLSLFKSNFSLSSSISYFLSRAAISSIVLCKIAESCYAWRIRSCKLGTITSQGVSILKFALCQEAQQVMLWQNAQKNTTGFAQIQVTPYNVAMAGRVGDDLLGQYFKNSMTQNGVEFLSPSQPGTSTGTVIVLTTPDAQRTFLAFQGDSNFEVPADHLEIFTKAKIIVIEGYLLEHQNSLEKILKIINFAKQAGVLTAVSAGDPGLVKRCRTAFNKIIESGVDIFLSNQAEAVTFLELPQSTDAQDAAMLLGKRCPIAVVTDGSKGSHIYEQQQDKCYSMKPYWTSEPPVDTTGAGDAYAAGLLFGMIMGLQFQNCGELGSRMASAVIGQIGCRVRQEEADEVYNQFVNDVQEVRELIQSPI